MVKKKKVKENKMTKTAKYEIQYDKDLYDLLSDIAYNIYLAKNKATTIAYDWQNFSFSYNERFGKYPDTFELTGQKWISGDVNNILKSEYATKVHSMTRETAIKEACDKFNNDMPEIMKGNVSIARYRRDGSFPVRTSQISKLEKINNKKYTCKLSLLSREGIKERGLKNGQIDVTLKTGNGNNVILDRVMNGEYKMSDSRIVKKKTKFYLLLYYTFIPQKMNLDENKIMGIDVGITIPATLAVSYNNRYRMYVGNGKEVRDFENQIVARKKRIQESRKWAGKGSTGHGNKTRTKAVNRVKGKIQNFKQTKNHNWSKFIVEQAVKMGCGTIQMEDLTGISEENTFLKNWTFYQLKQYIKYKAEQVGIKVVDIDPKYTSSRCNKCGFVHIDKRSKQEKNKSYPKWRPTQDQFHCQNCGHKDNADANAAKNIAMKNIDKIIKEQVALQDKQLKHAMMFAD